MCAAGAKLGILFSLSVMDFRRLRQRNTASYQSGPLILWINRDIRLRDNWALVATARMAKELEVPFGILYSLDPHFLGGGLRQLTFKVEALRELEEDARQAGIPFFLAMGEDLLEDTTRILTNLGAGAVVTDFSPLRSHQQWISTLAQKLSLPFFEVDTHNIVPAWIVSQKQEFGAYTLRPKIHRLLPEYLGDPAPDIHGTLPWPGSVPVIDWEHILTTSRTRRDILPTGRRGGERAAREAMEDFLRHRLPTYHTARNDPSLDGQSDLSPYLHYGCLAPEALARAVQDADAPAEAKAAFLEELIVRRELADNFCLYAPHYDTTASFHPWAQKTLDEHRGDPRPILYTREQLESARTHDPLWNAAQREMVSLGKMHGYLRMYWAKKLLEWTSSPEEALAIGIALNDTYELDGRDPNGYAGLAWSIGGVHDRAWGERPIFGKIRYMNDKGCRRKFDVDAYITHVEERIRQLQK